MGSWIQEGSRIANASRAWQEAEDTPVAGWDKANHFIIALAIGQDSHLGDTDTFKVQWRASGGSWADLGAAGKMKQSSATDLVNNDDVTAGEAGCTSALAFEQEAGELEGANTTPSITLSQNGWCEVQCAVDPADSDAGVTYEFQLRIVGDGKDLGVGAATLAIASGVQTLVASPIAVTSSVQKGAVSGSGIAPLTETFVPVSSSIQTGVIAGEGIAPLTPSPVAVVSSVRQAVIAGIGEAPLATSPVAVVSSVRNSAVEIVGGVVESGMEVQLV